MIHALGRAGARPAPLTANHIEAVGTMLKAAYYRISYNYVNSAMKNSIALGCRWDDQPELAGRAFSSQSREAWGRVDNPSLFSTSAWPSRSSVTHL